jgi:hypothetical protein
MIKKLLSSSPTLRQKLDLPEINGLAFFGPAFGDNNL